MWLRRLFCRVFGHRFSISNTIVTEHGFLRACHRCDYDYEWRPR